jgi:hypothetical protein
MVYNTKLLGFWTLSIVRNSKYKKAQRFGNWIGFRPQVRREDTYSVGPLRKNQIQGPNRVGVFFPSPEDGSRSSFRNVSFQVI